MDMQDTMANLAENALLPQHRAKIEKLASVFNKIITLMLINWFAFHAKPTLHPLQMIQNVFVMLDGLSKDQVVFLTAQVILHPIQMVFVYAMLVTTKKIMFASLSQPALLTQSGTQLS